MLHIMLHNLTCHCAGVDVTANQEEISDHETFQLEFEPKLSKWSIRTMQVNRRQE